MGGWVWIILLFLSVPSCGVLGWHGVGWTDGWDSLGVSCNMTGHVLATLDICVALLSLMGGMMEAWFKCTFDYV